MAAGWIAEVKLDPDKVECGLMTAIHLTEATNPATEDFRYSERVDLSVVGDLNKFSNRAKSAYVGEAALRAKETATTQKLNTKLNAVT